MNTEGLEKKLAAILDSLHKYSPHAWEQMVSYEFASAVTAAAISLIFVLASIVCSWLTVKHHGDDDDEFMPVMVILVSVLVSLVAIFVIGTRIPSLLFPEAAVLRGLFP